MVATGKHSNAILTPSTSGVWNGNIAIKLGTHEHDCLGNITLCPNGATFSLWFHPVLLDKPWGTLFESTSLIARCKQNSDGFQMYFDLNNGSHTFEFNQMPWVAWHKWYHIGITYSKESGYAVHFDGCIPKLANSIAPRNATASKNFVFGCVPFAQCVRAYYDDLRFWNVKKSPVFIWGLSNM